jgi:sensor histidine kinase YesM
MERENKNTNRNIITKLKKRKDDSHGMGMFPRVLVFHFLEKCNFVEMPQISLSAGKYHGFLSNITDFRDICWINSQKDGIFSLA